MSSSRVDRREQGSARTAHGPLNTVLRGAPALVAVAGLVGAVACGGDDALSTTEQEITGNAVNEDQFNRIVELLTSDPTDEDFETLIDELIEELGGELEDDEGGSDGGDDEEGDTEGDDDEEEDEEEDEGESDSEGDEL